MKWLDLRFLGLICRLAVGGVFVFASLDKLAHPDAFAVAVHHYRMVPIPLLHVFAGLLPVLEIVTGIALITGFRVRGAALLSGLMTLLFMVAITTALARGLDISCGCFNTDGGHAVGLSLLFRDVVLLALCLPPLMLSDAGPGIDRMLGRRP